MEENKTTPDNPQHQELLKLVNPLIAFMMANNYNYVLVAGKDGTATNHFAGDKADISGMLKGLTERHVEFKELLGDVLNYTP